VKTKVEVAKNEGLEESRRTFFFFSFSFKGMSDSPPILLRSLPFSSVLPPVLLLLLLVLLLLILLLSFEVSVEQDARNCFGFFFF